MPGESRWLRGYESSPQVEKFVEKVSSPAPWRTLFDGLWFHASLIALCVVVALCIGDLYRYGWAAPLYFVVAVLCARQLRALELIVHDASHSNFIRGHDSWKDRIANMLFAAPVAQSVAQYWATHSRHHRKFGTGEDPCRNRMLELSRIDPGPRRAGDPLFSWLIGKARFYWRYSSSYYRTVARDAAWGTFALWHLIAGAATALAASALLDVHPFVWGAAWLLVWIVPLFLFLPIQRLLAERGEHDYEGGTDEFSATIMNVGFSHRAILHPWNDSYHLLHHLHPAIPQCRHRWVHRELEKIDPVYRAARRRWTINGSAGA